MASRMHVGQHPDDRQLAIANKTLEDQVVIDWINKSDKEVCSSFPKTIVSDAYRQRIRHAVTDAEAADLLREVGIKRVLLA